MNEEARRWIAEIGVAFGEDGQGPFEYATGIPITERLVLTVAHVLGRDGPAGAPSPSRIKIRFPNQEGAAEHEARVLWNGFPDLDALVLEVKGSPGFRAIAPVRGNPRVHLEWWSEGFPEAGVKMTPEGELRSAPVPVTGKIVRPPLDREPMWLVVDAEPEAKHDWQGLSGGPVFVQGLLCGLMLSYSENMRDTLHALSVARLLDNGAFLQATGLGRDVRWIEKLRGEVIGVLEKHPRAVEELVRHMEQGPLISVLEPRPADVVTAALDMNMVDWARACNHAHKELCAEALTDGGECVYAALCLLLPSLLGSGTLGSLRSQLGTIVRLPVKSRTVAETYVAALYGSQARFRDELEQGVAVGLTGVPVPPESGLTSDRRLHEIRKHLFKLAPEDLREGVNDPEEQDELINEELEFRAKDSAEPSVHYYLYPGRDADDLAYQLRQRYPTLCVAKLSEIRTREEHPIIKHLGEIVLRRSQGRPS